MWSLAIFLVTYLLVFLSFGEVVFRFALSHLPGGVQLFCFPLAPFQSVLLVLSGALVCLPGSLLCLPPGYRSSSFQFPVVWLVLRLPSLQPYTRPLGCSSVSSLGVSSLCAFLGSRLLCSLASLLVLGSSFPVLVIFSFLLSGVFVLASGSCLCAPLVCFLLLSTRGLPLVSVSWDVYSRPSVRFSLLFFWP